MCKYFYIVLFMELFLDVTRESKSFSGELFKNGYNTEISSKDFMFHAAIIFLHSQDCPSAKMSIMLLELPDAWFGKTA